MAIYDHRVCKQCGRMGVTRHTCPSCPCNFCKKEGHIADNCELLKKRKEKSQQIGSSPQDTSLLRKRQLDSDSENPRKKSVTNATTVARNRSLSPIADRSSARNDVSQALDPKILQLGSVATVLPQLEPLATYILEKILSDKCPDPFKCYRDKIARYGEAKIVLNDMMEAIDTQFQALQGQEATLEALREIQRTQALDKSLWDGEGGYLDCITDKRCPSYFRLYVGQATILSKRTAAHVIQMASGNVSTLHYYVKSMGGTHREANFLRIFQTQYSKRSQEDRDLVKNLLELEMCVALRTLPQKELMQWLPPGSPEIRYPSVHLNVANPLVQGSSNSPTARQSSRNLLLDSADPEIRQWPAVRGRQLAAQGPGTTAVPYVPLADYAPIFNNAVKANSRTLGQLECFDPELKVPFDKNFWKSGCLEKCEDAIGHYLGRAVPLVRPSGPLESRIAIIVNGVDSSSITDQDNQFVPYGLREMGLNAVNTITWPFNLRRSGMSRPDEISTELAAVEAAYFKDYSFSLIAASSARFILICEGIQQRYMFDQARGLSPPIEITLRGYNVLFRFMLDGTKIQRVFVVIPDPKRLMRGGDWRSVQKFAQTVRLATVLAKMEGIEYNFFENNRAYASIFRAKAEEKSLGIPLTTQLLDCWVRQWLSRKGFKTNEDIEELKKLAGSLTDGLFVLLCCLPKYHGVGRAPSQKGVGHAPSQKGVTKEPKYPKELLRAVRKLRSDKVQEFLGEDDQDKVPDIIRVMISRKEDDPDASNDELESMMEISFGTTDDPQICIAEIHDSDTRRRQREEARSELKRCPLRASLVRNLYNGGTRPIRSRQAPLDGYLVQVLFLRIVIPTQIDLDHERAATVKAKLADWGSKQPARIRLATNDAATAMAQRLAISVTVFTKKGSTVTFWARRTSLSQAIRAHNLVTWLEEVQAEEGEQAEEAVQAEEEVQVEEEEQAEEEEEEQAEEEVLVEEEV